MKNKIKSEIPTHISGRPALLEMNPSHTIIKHKLSDKIVWNRLIRFLTVQTLAKNATVHEVIAKTSIDPDIIELI